MLKGVLTAKGKALKTFTRVYFNSEYEKLSYFMWPTCSVHIPTVGPQ